MPVHDWTRVSAGVFHAFHVAWIGELQKALNGGILPDGYYALAEQVAGRTWPDVLTLQAPGEVSSHTAPKGGTAIQKAPPKVRFTSVADEREIYALKRRTLVIRHSSGDKVVALLEIVSPGNKSHRGALQRFLDKAVSALTSNIHLLLIDLHPPGPQDPLGIHGALRSESDRRPTSCPATSP